MKILQRKSPVTFFIIILEMKEVKISLWGLRSGKHSSTNKEVKNADEKSDGTTEKYQNNERPVFEAFWTHQIWWIQSQWASGTELLERRVKKGVASQKILHWSFQGVLLWRSEESLLPTSFVIFPDMHVVQETRPDVLLNMPEVHNMQTDSLPWGIRTTTISLKIISTNHLGWKLSIVDRGRGIMSGIHQRVKGTCNTRVWIKCPQHGIWIQSSEFTLSKFQNCKCYTALIVWRQYCFYLFHPRTIPKFHVVVHVWSHLQSYRRRGQT